MPQPLPDGLYEHLLTESLRTALEAFVDGRQRELRALEPADASRRIARYLAAEIERALESVPDAQRPALQIEIANRVLACLDAALPDVTPARAHLVPPGSELRALFRGRVPERPTTPLSQSTLLTRSPSDPSLARELALEIGSAERIDVIVAFITMSGVRALSEQLQTFARRVHAGQAAGAQEHAPRLRVLTTVYGGTTEPRAVEFLAGLPGAQVKVSYDTRRTRLHAKAWLFERDSRLHSAYVGSANLTSTALGSGQEWMVKICAADLPDVIDKFRGTFESLWNDAEFEPYDPKSEQCQAQLRAGLRAERQGSGAALAFFRLRPFPFQEEILERLETERRVHGRRRNLVVAATGTGKTVVAAFDYARQVEHAGVTPRLLFLAHRAEILEQARTTFRQVLRDAAFGELLVGGEEPQRWEHVFATIQSAVSRDLLGRLGAEHFRYVVVDECHHAPADSYRRLVPALRPEILLGLTATPERSDGKPLLGDFDDHIAAELRIWDALERQLLVPFEYYGIADGVDLERVRWTRSGYEHAALSGLYTGNEKRVDLIVQQLRLRVADVRAIRGLAFCVSVEHAEYMAKGLSLRGIPALALHGGSDSALRADAPRRLRAGECNVLCVCDLYNEGVDLPFVDTLLFLRPTASATLFLQQLGRGLRHDDERQGRARKTSCLVLDFIGRQRAEFRFDATLAALTGISRSRLTRAVKEGFPFLPSGCVLQLDAVSRQHVLTSLKEHLGKRTRLLAEITELTQESGQVPTLFDFLDATQRELDDVYAGNGGWTTLKREAGVLQVADASLDDSSRRLGWLRHADDAERFDTWRRAARGEVRPSNELERRRFAMLSFQLEHRGVVKSAAQISDALRRDPEIARELNELADALERRAPASQRIHPVAEWPLALHSHYERREIVSAIGHVEAGKKGTTPQGGILKLTSERRELLLVTLDKSHHSFSPSTRYRDYAISPTLFHWETQSIASVERESGRRYTESPGNGWTFHLFVRTHRDAAYAYLGPAVRVAHEGDRPIAITWRLTHALPASLFTRYATLSQG